MSNPTPQVDALDEKKCSKCKEIKPVAEFSRNKKYASGYISQCRLCVSKWFTEEYYPKNNTGINARTKEYRQEHRVAINQNTYAKQDPGKQKARRAVNNALAAGKITKPTECPSCGNSGYRIEGHHKDYSKALEVDWMCMKCHAKLHRELRATARSQNG